MLKIWILMIELSRVTAANIFQKQLKTAVYTYTSELQKTTEDF